jgi:nucleotide-binding universal stress UspA family protein
MNHIIVPVDLSKNSKEALRYASHIAAATGAGLTVVFGYNLLEKAIRYVTKKGVVDKDPDKWIQKRVIRINTKRPEIDVNFKIIQGDIIDSIKRLAEQKSAGLVIMGCQGKGENPNTFLGSTAGEMIRDTQLPVLLVPPRYKFQGIKNVVLAVKNTSVRYMGTLEPIIRIKQAFHPQIQLLHLGGEQDPLPAKSFSILQLINDITRYGHDNLQNSLREYLEQHPSDMVCLLRRKRGTLEKSIGSSRTPVEKLRIDIPVLVLAGEDY